MKGIISIQSHVTYGHAGNSCAVFPIQRLGYEVFPINTVQFSNHTQYEQAWNGTVMPPSHIIDIMNGLKRNSLNNNATAVITGYLGSPEQGAAVLEVLNHVSGIYVCDPVMPDPSKGCKMADGMPEMWREIIDHADIIVPNQYELEQLSGVTISNLETCVDAVCALQTHMVEKTGRRATAILVKQLELNDGMFTMLLEHNKKFYMVQRPNIQFDKAPVGVGDLITALFTANYLTYDDIGYALVMTNNAVADVMTMTKALNEYELQLIASQHCFEEPLSSYPIIQL